MKLNEADISIKILLTLFLMLLCASFVVSGFLVNHTYKASDSQAFFPSKEELLRHYQGSTMENAVYGGMAKYLPTEFERKIIMKWLQKGGQRTGFYENIQPLLARRCISCHGSGATSAKGISLLIYSQVQPYSTNIGPSFKDMIRSTHIHLAGIGLLFFALGVLVSLIGFSRLFRIIAITVPFSALFTDAASLWLMRIWPGAVFLALAAGAMLYLSAGFSIIVVLCDLWLYDLWAKRRDN